MSTVRHIILEVIDPWCPLSAHNTRSNRPLMSTVRHIILEVIDPWCPLSAHNNRSTKPLMSTVYTEY